MHKKKMFPSSHGQENQIVKVNVISSAGLIRFFAGEILHANVNALEKICDRKDISLVHTMPVCITD